MVKRSLRIICIYPEMFVVKILTGSFCACQSAEDPDPSVAQKCDVCLTSPCKNGGKCTTVEFRSFHCDCAPGFHGLACEQEIDACFGNPCNNGGKCEALEHGRFR